MDSVKEYLLNLFLAHKDYNRILYTSEFADWMNVSNASISEMVRKLATKGYLVVKPYKGFYLTKEGVKKAFTFYKNFNVLKRFFEQILNMKNAELEAERFSDASKTLISAMEAYMGIRERGTIKKMTEGKGNCLVLFYFGRKEDAHKKFIIPDEKLKILEKTTTSIVALYKNKKIRIPIKYASKTYCYFLINSKTSL